MHEFEFHRCTRRCAVTGREFDPGEDYYSVLSAHGSRLERIDVAASAWRGPPEKAIAWWKSTAPHREGKPTPPTGEALFSLFEALADQPDQAALRYVLALLLVRRRLLRVDESGPENNENRLRVVCPRHDLTYDVPVVLPEDDARASLLQAELDRLLAPAA